MFKATITQIKLNLALSQTYSGTQLPVLKTVGTYVDVPNAQFEKRLVGVKIGA